MNRWNSCRVAAAQLPETELEAKLSEIRRQQAKFSREQRLKECWFWMFLFDCDRELRRSLTRKFTEKDILVASVEQLKQCYDDSNTEMTVSEFNRQFTEFKALLTIKLKQCRRPAESLQGQSRYPYVAGHYETAVSRTHPLTSNAPRFTSRISDQQPWPQQRLCSVVKDADRPTSTNRVKNHLRTGTGQHGVKSNKTTCEKLILTRRSCWDESGRSGTDVIASNTTRRRLTIGRRHVVASDDVKLINDDRCVGQVTGSASSSEQQQSVVNIHQQHRHHQLPPIGEM